MQRVESTVPYGAPCCTGIDSVPESDRWPQEGHSWGTPNRDVGYAVDLHPNGDGWPRGLPGCEAGGRGFCWLYSERSESWSRPHGASGQARPQKARWAQGASPGWACWAPSVWLLLSDDLCMLPVLCASVSPEWTEVANSTGGEGSLSCPLGRASGPQQGPGIPGGAKEPFPEPQGRRDSWA